MRLGGWVALEMVAVVARAKNAAKEPEGYLSGQAAQIQVLGALWEADGLERLGRGQGPARDFLRLSGNRVSLADATLPLRWEGRAYWANRSSRAVWHLRRDIPKPPENGSDKEPLICDYRLRDSELRFFEGLPGAEAFNGTGLDHRLWLNISAWITHLVFECDAEQEMCCGVRCCEWELAWWAYPLFLAGVVALVTLSLLRERCVERCRAARLARTATEYCPAPTMAPA